MGSRGRGRPAGAALSIVVSLMLVAALAPPSADAATVTNAWRAKIGSAGVNGLATVSAYTTGTGSIVLKLAKLRPATYLPVTLYKGTCSSVGAVLIKFPTIRSTSTGAAARTSSLTAAQVTLIKNATKATGRIAIRVGSATTGGIKCGLFAVLAVPPYVAARITVGHSPSGIAVAPNGVWVTNWFDNSLSRIDPATNSVLQTVPLTIAGTGGPESIGFGEGSLWVTVTDVDTGGNPLPGSLLRIDPTTGTQVATIPVGRDPFGIAVTPGAVWVAAYNDNVVARIDPATNAAIASIPVAGGPEGVTFGAGSIWVSGGDGRVSRIDPATNAVTATIQTQDTGGMIAFGANAIWVTNVGHKDTADGTVSRIDPATNAVTASISVGATVVVPWQIAVGGGSVWVGLFDTPVVIQLSATTNAIIGRIAVGNSVYALAATDHAVWAVHNLPTPDGSTSPPAGIVSRITY